MPRQRSVSTDTGGYSLVEVMTVLVLILLLVGMAVPSLGSYVEQQKTRSALDLVAADLAYARALAVREGETTVVEFEPDGDYLIRVEGDPVQVVKRVALTAEYPGMTLTSPNGDGRLTFDRRGLIRDIGSGSFVASMHGSSDALSITATGRVYRDY